MQDEPERGSRERFDSKLLKARNGFGDKFIVLQFSLDPQEYDGRQSRVDHPDSRRGDNLLLHYRRLLRRGQALLQGFHDVDHRGQRWRLHDLVRQTSQVDL